MDVSDHDDTRLRVCVLTRRPTALPRFPAHCGVVVVDVGERSPRAISLPERMDLLICFPVSHSLIDRATAHAARVGAKVAMVRTGASGLARRVLAQTGIDLGPSLVGVGPTEAAGELAREAANAVAPADGTDLETRILHALEVGLGAIEARIARIESDLSDVLLDLMSGRERHRARIQSGMRRAKAAGLRIGRPMRDDIDEIAVRQFLATPGASVRGASRAFGVPASTLHHRMARWTQQPAAPAATSTDQTCEEGQPCR